MGSERYRILVQCNNTSIIYTIREDGIVYDNSSIKTNYSVRGLFYLFEGEENVSNIYLRDSPLKTPRTTFLFTIYSDDDGLTWSQPREMNQYLK